MQTVQCNEGKINAAMKLLDQQSNRDAYSPYPKAL